MATDTSQHQALTPAASDALDIKTIQADFPILRQEVNGHRLVYLDNAASSQKPHQVIDALSDYYRTFNSNIHRGLHTLAERATETYEQTRAHTARFIGATSSDEIIFTRGATESLNLLAYTFGEQRVSQGDIIVVTEMEHHANFVPWFELARRKGATLRSIPITDDGLLDLDNLDGIITDRTKIVAVSHMSNVLGTINPLNPIARRAHDVGAVIVADGAQAAPHLPVDVSGLDIDFYAFSSHKMLGPTGVGVLWGRKELLEQMDPFNFGGEMIRNVSFERVTWNDLPHKFEAGTPNIGGVIAFDAALTYLEKLSMTRVRNHEMELTAYALEQLDRLGRLEIQGPRDVSLRGGAISFTDPDIHPHDISTFLDSRGIAIRAGHHCAQPLMRRLGKVATARSSLYIYNDRSDVDALIDALEEMRKYFRV